LINLILIKLCHSTLDLNIPSHDAQNSLDDYLKIVARKGRGARELRFSDLGIGFAGTMSGIMRKKIILRGHQSGSGTPSQQASSAPQPPYRL